MLDADFNELAGRIDGIAQAFLHLAAEAERQGAADGPRLTAALRQRARYWPACPEQAGLQRTLYFLADQLDDARSARRGLLRVHDNGVLMRRCVHAQVT